MDSECANQQGHATIVGDTPTGCLTCTGDNKKLDPQEHIGVGLGYAALLRDGVIVWAEKSNMDWDELLTAEQAEAIAMEEPNHDWRIIMHGPLCGRTYQRQGKNNWMMIEKNEGFA